MRATPSDAASAVELMRQFHEEYGLMGFPFSPDHARQFFLSHLQSGALALIEPGQALFLARVIDHPLGMGRVAVESLWYVAKNRRGKSGIRFLDYYERWAAAMGCVAVNMVSLAANNVSSIYKRRGYVPAEMHFLKVL